MLSVDDLEWVFYKKIIVRLSVWLGLVKILIPIDGPTEVYDVKVAVQIISR